jgi:hypothetical protein
LCPPGFVFSMRPYQVRLAPRSAQIRQHFCHVAGSCGTSSVAAAMVLGAEIRSSNLRSPCGDRRLGQGRYGVSPASAMVFGSAVAGRRGGDHAGNRQCRTGGRGEMAGFCLRVRRRSDPRPYPVAGRRRHRGCARSSRASGAAPQSKAGPGSAFNFAQDIGVAARAGLALLLWLSGEPDRARVRQLRPVVSNDCASGWYGCFQAWCWRKRSNRYRARHRRDRDRRVWWRSFLGS